MKKLSLFSIMMFPLLAIAQDIHFSQVINNPLHINPANTGGYDGYERVILNYRDQWTSVHSTFTTMGFSFDSPVFQKEKSNKAHLGVGLTFFSDKAGDSKFGLSQGALSIAGIVPMNESSNFIGGIQIGYGQRSADISALQWGTQFDGKEWNSELPSYESNTIGTFGYIDLGAGVRWEYKNKADHIKGWDIKRFSVGAAMYHVNKPQLRYFSGGSEKLAAKMVFHFNGEFDLPNTNYSIIPFGTYFSQGPLHEINVGALVKIQLKPGTKITGLLNEQSLYAGVQLRIGDALIPQLMYEFSSFSIGCSFDYNISSLKTVSRGTGGFEVAIKYHHKKGALFKRRGARVYE
jgi:type IX secretion system PorP/SprF family membrane protein